jgi:alpha-mannosidase
MRLFRYSLAAAALGILAPIVLAQSFQRITEINNLSPEAQSKLKQIEDLSELPAGEWRMHAGDIPHGESVALDDSAWPLVEPNPHPPAADTMPATPDTKQAIWLRRTIEVPKTVNGYDITGDRVWFQLRSTGSPSEIIYFNGRRVALGDDLEPIVLFEPAHPGDKVVVAVKLLRTTVGKELTAVNMRIEPLGTDRPNPFDVRTECITAANLLPALPQPHADLLPVVEKAVAAIDMKALAAGKQAAFDDSLRQAESILAPLHSLLTEAKVDLDGNSHIDAAWLWPRSETIDVVKRTFTTALQLMDEYPTYVFTQSAAQYSEWMADKYPALNAEIAERVKEGRWEIVGGMWVEPDLNLPGGESLVRQLLVGQREFQKLYGVTARIGWNPDSFGYNWQLPQIYKRSGLDYFVTQKMHWNDTNLLPFRLFWWESPDGSKVLTYFPTDYVHSNVSPARLSADFADAAKHNPGVEEELDLYGIGDHGGGPTRAMLDEADHWIAASRQPKEPLPTMRYSTAQHYFDDVQAHLSTNSPTWDYDKMAAGYKAPQPDKAGDIGIPTWNDELYLEYHRGVYTTQAAHKRNMRASETATLNAEKLASIAWLDGATYPADILTDNWKKITFNQFHDLAAGSGIATIYRDAQKDFTAVFNADKLIDTTSISTMDANIDTLGQANAQRNVAVLVDNTMAWPRSELVPLHVELPEAANAIKVLDAKGNDVPTQITDHIAGTNEFDLLARVADVPSLGYTVLHAESASTLSMKDDTDLHLEDAGASFLLSNAHLKLTIDKQHGCITSIAAASSNTEYLAPQACGNQLQTYIDKPKQYDAWNIDPGTYDGLMTPIDEVDSIKVITDGALRKTIEIKRTWHASHFTQDISLDAGANVVRVDSTVDWHETHVLLKAAFQLAHTAPKATFEIPYGAIERPTTRNNSWQKAQFEVPALRWADLGDTTAGVAILNDSKYGYDALGSTLRLTLLRSPTYPDPDADRGTQRFSYEIYPHAGTWKQAETVRYGYDLNTPMIAQQVFAHTGTLPATHSFASVEEANIVLSAVKKAEDANALIFRVYEAEGEGGDRGTMMHLHVPPGAAYAIETNLMETPLPNAPHLPLTGDTVTLPVRPWEIRTIEVVYPQHAAAEQRAAMK